ncbi:MAG: STAS domain-containing protein [Planctomycetota bacterium]
MKVLKLTLPDVVVLTLKGEFDTFVTNAFSAEVAKVLGEGIHRIVLNMQQVQFINSTALGAMIKARKACRAAEGDLVISSPSAAVREAMESLGLERLFAIHDDDEAALAAVEQRGAIDLEGDSESAVMIYVPESPRPIIARLRRLDADTLECKLPGPPAKLIDGREVRLKFRLPLYRREYFELSARIEHAQAEAAGTSLSLRFTQVTPEDAQAIASFVADMSELRRAARGG